MASKAAALTGSATSKSGRPIERLIGSTIDFDMSNALRMPEASIDLIRSAIQASFTVGLRRWGVERREGVDFTGKQSPVGRGRLSQCEPALRTERSSRNLRVEIRKNNSWSTGCHEIP